MEYSLSCFLEENYANIRFSLQYQLRQHSDAIASSIVLEQGKTYAGMSWASRIYFACF